MCDVIKTRLIFFCSHFSSHFLLFRRTFVTHDTYQDFNIILDGEKSLEDLSEGVPEILVNIPQPDEGYIFFLDICDILLLLLFKILQNFLK